MCDKAAKALTLELSKFSKRNDRRFHILGDLSLTLKTIKTPEVRTSIRDMTQQYFRELQLESQSLDKRLQRIIQEEQKKDKKKDKKDKDAVIKVLEAAVAAAITKELKVPLGSNSSLKLKFKGLKKAPFLEWTTRF